MHENAAHPWTVPELAAISGLSRAAFARVFREALGQAPMQYLTEWRMTVARDHLRAGELTLPQIADAAGYGSPPWTVSVALSANDRLPTAEVG
ncbi:helix-turn-helix transcriptional regulator [Streptomyces sp. NPDC016566]|uniref:helix-turn-helix transcriptional regulator n=1 Tax=unclassified Streptomyces TaxID=2593676 RepID=UPI0036E136AB